MRLLTFCLILPLFTMLAPRVTSSMQQSNDRYQLSFGVQSTQIGSAVVVFLGFVTADDFFRDIEKTTGSGDVTFSKHGAPLESFPEVLTVRVVASVPRQKSKPGKGYPLDPDPAVMSSLHFRAEWKTDMALRQVTGFSFESVKREDGPIEAIREQWIYNFTLSGKNVPLTDHLIVTVLSNDNKVLLRMSASL
jgi:hypothetical protein